MKAWLGEIVCPTSLFVRKSNIRFVSQNQFVLLAGSHDQGMVPNEILHIMDVPRIPFVVGVFRNGLEGTPVGLKVIDLNVGPQSFGPLSQGGTQAIAVMRRANHKSQSHLIHGNLILYLEHEFGLHLAFTEIPLDLTTAYAIGEGSVRFNKFRLFESKVK